MKSLIIYLWTHFLSFTPKSVVNFFTNLTDSKLFSIFITPLIAFLVVHEILIFTLLGFIAVDWWTGIEKDIHLKQIDLKLFRPKTWKNLRIISSEGIRRTFNKIKDYFMLIVVIFFLEVNVLGKTLIDFNEKSLTITAVFLSLLCIVEVYSIFENKEATGTTNYFKFILEFIPEKWRKQFKKEDKE